MTGTPTGPSGRDRVFSGSADRWIARAILFFLVIAIPVESSGPSLAGLPFDLGMSVFFAVMGWVCFRMGFRTRLVARSDHFEVVNVLTEERVAYGEVASIQRDLLSVSLTLGCGRRIRVWGLVDALMDTGGPRGQGIVDRLGGIVEERQTGGGPQYSRTRLHDWWVALVLFILFAGLPAITTG